MEIFEMEKEFDALMKKGQELIEKLKKEKSKKVKRWKPKVGKDYYTIRWNGKIDYYTWDNGVSDNNCFILGNCFQTKEEAQKELERRVAEQELLDLADGSVNDNAWFEIEYAPYDDCFTSGQYSTITSSCYRFATEESVKKAIKQLGEDKLKLIFRID